jgi:hypothetical protein
MPGTTNRSRGCRCPPRDHPSYPAAAALALLDAAYAGKTSAGEAATGLVDHDPYNARSVLRLMGALDAAGCRVEALRHAHLYEERLRAALDVEPEEAVAEYSEQLRRGGVGRRLGTDGSREKARPRPPPARPAARAKRLANALASRRLYPPRPISTGGPPGWCWRAWSWPAPWWQPGRRVPAASPVSSRCGPPVHRPWRRSDPCVLR